MSDQNFRSTHLPWLGSLPLSWRVIPAKAVFRERRAPSLASDVHLTPSQVYGVIPQAEYMEITGNRVVLNLEGQDNMKHVEPDDFIIHLRSFQGGIERSTQAGKVSTAYTVLTPNEGMLSDYYRWLLKSQGYIQELRTTTNQLRDGQSIKYRDFTKVALPVPPKAEQRAIANYLDRETGQIDWLIAEQENLIRLLRERRATVVDRVVWGGLNASVEMSATGVEPAPLAPAHWRRLRNKNVLVESSDLSAGTEELLSVSHLTGVTPRAGKNVTMLESEDLSAYRLVRVGDLAINTMWAWMGALGVSRVNGIVSPAYGVYRALQGAEFDPGYFDYLYRSRPYVVEMTRHSRGIWSSRLRLYPEVFLRLPVLVPPLDEQIAIREYLDAQTHMIDRLIIEVDRLIELARERRAALITAAVTGQIDSRGTA